MRQLLENHGTASSEKHPATKPSMSPASAATALALLACCITAGGLPGAVAAGDMDTVSARRPLRGNDTVVSAHGKFELGLFSPGASGRFYLGIWYKNVPVQTVIWVGNRVNPLSGSGVASTELRVSSSDGNLELVGLSPSSATAGVVWSSNLSSSSVSSSPGSNVAVMRDNGNLVLLDGGNSSNVLWQSFDHPTDTLVTEAWLGEDKLTGEYQALTSWRNAEDPAPGMFTDTVDRNGSSEFFYLWNGSRAYWRSGVWTGRVFANLPEAVNNVLFNQTYVETPAYRRVTNVLYDNATVTRMVLDLTGQTKQFIWVPGSQSWQFFWAAPTVQCDVYALCGAFGVCNQRSQTPCQCPPGFAPAADRDWGLSDWSAGCHRSLPLQCGGNGSTDGFLELPGMKLPDDSLSVAGAQSKAECELACLNNCSCQAYTFSGGGCAVWHDGFRNLQQLFPDAGSGGSSSSSLYLRLSESELQHLRGANNGKKNRRRRLWLALGIVLACIAALGVSAVAAWILVSRRRRRAEMANQKSSSSLVVAKADVYSFGMVLFEIISGRRNAEEHGASSDDRDSSDRESTFFPVWAAVRVAEGDTAAVADARLRGDVSEDELERACRVACWCIQDQEAHRPPMAHVVQALEGLVDVDMPPVPRALQHLATLA
ncbi:unnamed protein product [Miscanthus lutarioriparius]|uniref:non-specific serine/threonine protein kinase n=1 Tax=Miscanthus lutarioriparius TaxID=422564 RepID=A0A811S3M0_9POAL|nr:unnamed protein product [Miscanthus lutarioriparius]